MTENRFDINLMEIARYADNVLGVAIYPDAERGPLENWGLSDSIVPLETRRLQRELGKPAALGSFEAIAGEEGMTLRLRLSGTDVLSLDSYAFTSSNVPGDTGLAIEARFAAFPDEAFYGFGQHQLDWMDHRGREVQVWHDYAAEGGEIIGIPILVSSRGYAVVWNNPSRTVVTPGVDGSTTWKSQIGGAISFFVVTGSFDEIYAGIRLLIGETPLPPRYALGYIQCKQRYKNRDEVLNVARGYRDRGYPCDVLVVDWFHWKVLGDMDLDEEHWPDAAGMNAELSDMGFHSMISCWPRFKKESRYFDELESKRWFMEDLHGRTVYGTPKDQRGALIDTTDEEAGRWYWRAIHANYASKGFTSWWLDENEPDISPHEFRLAAGSGARVHNIYPLMHTKAVYEGHRRDLEKRCLILSRSAYFGAQRHGTTFWSSDIAPTWDVFRRQIPAGLNFCASGFAYWSSDIGGWHPLPKADDGSPPDYSHLLVQSAGSAEQGAAGLNYPEMYIRWFQFGAFCPTFRAHGTRPENEVWSFGKEAEKILVKYLRLRYRLLPYIYSLAYGTYRTGAPVMRALWMDFPGDPKVRDMKYQYMFGPAFLVAPVTEQGARTQRVYLPTGTDWYDYWSDRRYSGGQWLEVPAELDKLPLFVRAGSIIPTGNEIQHCGQPQDQLEFHIYPGADGRFDLYTDDGITYAYETGAYAVAALRWRDTEGDLQVTGDSPPKYAIRIHQAVAADG